MEIHTIPIYCLFQLRNEEDPPSEDNSLMEETEETETVQAAPPAASQTAWQEQGLLLLD